MPESIGQRPTGIRSVSEGVHVVVVHPHAAHFVSAWDFRDERPVVVRCQVQPLGVLQARRSPGFGGRTRSGSHGAAADPQGFATLERAGDGGQHDLAGTGGQDHTNRRGCRPGECRACGDRAGDRGVDDPIGRRTRTAVSVETLEPFDTGHPAIVFRDVIFTVDDPACVDAGRCTRQVQATVQDNLRDTHRRHLHTKVPIVTSGSCRRSS